jgi:hypothetical protein
MTKEQESVFRDLSMKQGFETLGPGETATLRILAEKKALEPKHPSPKNHGLTAGEYKSSRSAQGIVRWQRIRDFLP